jgi:glutamyl-tRNA reductase
MREIVLIGINHKTAPVELRECIAFSPDESASALETLRRTPHIHEALLYSTCNRVELLLVTDDKTRAVSAAKEFISSFNKISIEQFDSSLYVYANDHAVRHLFRVASSLDSMIVGEPQILGQIKEAYRKATEARTAGVVLNRLMHRAFFVAKRIRTETGIGDRAVSISYAAVELGRKIFGSLEGKRVLLIGAGEMAELAVEHLIRNQVNETFVANRTFENGLALARRFNGSAIRFEEIGEHLKQVDIIISSTGAPGFVITREQVKPVIRARRNRPIFFIDIAVPRDIDPEINRLDNSYVYDIDDLKGIIEENIEDRQKEAVKGERIIDEAIIRFREWHEALDVVPTVVALRKKLEAMAEVEIKRTVQGQGGISLEGTEALQRMMAAFINKVLHEPTMFLKKDSMLGDKSAQIDTVRKMFKLDE